MLLFTGLLPMPKLGIRQYESNWKVVGLERVLQVVWIGRAEKRVVTAEWGEDLLKKGIDMNLQKCACVRINDGDEIRRYFEKKMYWKHVVSWCVVTQADDSSTLESVLSFSAVSILYHCYIIVHYKLNCVCTGWSKYLCVPDDYNTESYK
jgi:hypothetical protein